MANHVYKPLQAGVRAQGKEDEVSIGGITYKILEHVDNPDGYQGTIYQKKDTGEIIVAHRGTDQPLKDGGLAGGGMVFLRHHSQARDAILLTQHAHTGFALVDRDDAMQTPVVQSLSQLQALQQGVHAQRPMQPPADTGHIIA